MEALCSSNFLARRFPLPCIVNAGCPHGLNLNDAWTWFSQATRQRANYEQKVERGIEFAAGRRETRIRMVVESESLHSSAGRASLAVLLLGALTILISLKSY